MGKNLQIRVIGEKKGRKQPWGACRRRRRMADSGEETGLDWCWCGMGDGMAKASLIVLRSGVWVL